MKKILLITIFCISLFGMQKGFAQVTLSVWNGSAIDTAWFHDNRNASEFYIWTGAQLNGLAKLINSYETFAGKIVHVQNPDHPDDPVVIDLDNKTWKEIGTGYQGREFQGQFYGHNCVIKNIVTSPTGWKSYIGLFGRITSSSAGPAGVRDVNLTGRIISHWGTIGGIAGHITGTASNRAYISNCTFNGEVTGSSTIGGIVGTIAGYCDISDCAVAGTVLGFEYTVGGIVGSTGGSSNTITGCSNAAWITAPEYAGGIVGTMSGVTVKYCHNAGNVYGNSATTGGIASNGNNILYCINTGTVNMGGCITGASSVGSISYCYYDNQRSSSTMTGVRTVANDATHAIGTTHSHLVATADDVIPDGLGGTASEWTNHFSFKAGHYPIPKNLATKTAGIIASVPINLPESPDIAYYNEPANFTLVDGYAYTTDDPDHTIITIVGTDATVGDTEGAVLITVTNTGAGLRDDEIWSKTFIIENPYTSAPELTIADLSELEAFRNAVNAGASGKYQGISAYNGFKGVIIKITGNIDMGSISSWSPIGTYENPFKGTLDGQCHLLSNLTVERTAHNSGLFGVLNSAKIKNIKVTGNVHSTTLYVGGICARTRGAIGDSTVFTNCHYYGTVSNGSYYIGGIIGYAGSYCVVENCSSGGNITTTSYNCGGIIGQSGGALRVECCINIAEVKGLTQVGGIVGYSDNNTTKIYNCLNAGNVYGTSENTGGIIAYTAASQIKYCINTGTVSAGGSIVGRRTGDAATLLTNNYYDSQRSVREGTNAGDLAGAAPKTTSELLALTSGTFNDKWNYVSGSYPTPKNVGCDDPADAINNLVIVAAAPAIFNDGDNYTNLQHNITLSANVSWVSNNSDIISNTGVVNGAVGAVVLTAKKDGLERIEFKKKVLASVADISDPLMITSAAELAEFRDAVNAGLDGSFKGNMNLDGYCGRRFQLAGNISLTDPEWEPIGTSTNPFRGEFNGDGFKIDGLAVTRTVAYSGLFGYVYSSCSGGIKNLVVEGTVSGTSYVGGICGSVVGLNTTTYCTIENCHFNGEVRATSSYAGGIVGYMGNYTKTKYCTTSGEVFSTSSQVGGIVGRTAGYASSGYDNFCTYKRDSVLNCINNAIVTGTAHAGGICGYNAMSNVSYCLNAGEVKARANASSFGGIVGTNDIARGKVSQCLNVYNFNGFEGNIIGVDNDTITTICPRTDADINYYDSLHCAIGVKNEANGTGKRTNELVGTLPSTFTSDRWWIKAGYYPMPINAEGSYPSNPHAIALNPTLVAGSPATLAMGGPGTSDSDPDYVNTNQMTTRDFTIITSDGQTWTAPDDGILDVDGSNVWVNSPNYRRTYLTVSLGGYSKQMYFANSLYVPPIAIRDINELKALRDAVNRGSIGSFMACLYDEGTGKPQKKIVNGVPTDEYAIEEAFNVNGYKGVNFYLVNNEGTYFEVDLTNSNWSPIGTSTYIFKGSFHGKGNKIKTLRTNATYAGLFGYVEGSVIDNLNVQGYAYVNPSTGAISSDGATVYGSSYIGGLVGFAKNATIRNCHIAAIVNGTGSYVGGICGKSVGTVIENCDFSGKVIATVDYSGGICGYADASSIVSCTNAGTVSGASYVGGMVGKSDNGSTIQFCNNGGNISSTTEITGGICGNMDNSSMINLCISTGGVNIGGAILGTKDDASTISSCFYDTQRCDREGGSGTTGKLTSEMLGNGLRSALSTTHWAYSTSPSLYPVPSNLTGQAGATLAAIPLTLDERGNSSNHQTYRAVSKNFDLVVPSGASWATSCVRNDETDRTYLTITSNVPTVDGSENDCANIFVKYNDNYHVKSFFVQNPTIENPILIESLTQFIKFRKAVNDGEIGSYKGIVNEGGFTGKNFKLTVPIDLATGTDVNVKDDFLPIGTSKYPFKGNFDGDNNTISNFTINGNGTNNNSPTSYRALFGYAIGSTIENIKIRCTSDGISGSSYVAGICAYIRGVDGDNYANIRNCSFIGKISSTSSYVGGICGYAYYYTNIDTCEVAGTINGGSSYTGGIVGYAGGSSDYRNYVRSCINVADVGGINLVGGICGNNATTDILFCENGGNINGAVYSTGGISGSNSGDILYCLNTSNVSTGGAITGNGTNCHYNYYDRTRCSVNGIANDRNVSSDNDGAAIGLTPQQMIGTSPTGLIGTNWSDTYWNFSAGMFPTPKNHSSNITSVAAMPIFVNEPEPAQVWNGTIVNFNLGSSENIWTVDCEHDYVKIVPASLPTAFVDATDNIPAGEMGSAIITATIGEAHKNYIVTSANPPDSLSIRNYAELVAFRNAVNARGSGKYKGVLNSNGYVGITFYIINDIEVLDSEGPWVTIANEPGAFFAGNINGKDADGGIHTVSNLNFNTPDEVSFYGGFIGRLYNGYIKNLIVKTGDDNYSITTKPDGYFGGICAYISGQSSTLLGEIENCQFYSGTNGTITTGRENGSGGVCGYAAGWTKISNCKNYGNIAGGNYTGGVVGYMNNTSGAYVNFTNCRNEGNITYRTSDRQYLGGVCGRYYSTGTMTNCENYGNVTGGTYVGGIAGGQGGTSTYNAIITNCINYGDISTTAGKNYYGGITGNSTDFSTITYCANSGNVTAKQHVGGISGLFSKAAAEKENIIKYCSNTGEITGTKWVGGICGRNAKTTISFCVNGGNVRGTEAELGGIIGENGTESATKNNLSTGCVERNTGKPNLGGSICGKNAGSLGDNKYDKQRSKRLGLGSSSADDATAMGYKTSELTGTSPSGMSGVWNSDNFSFAANMYPQPKGVSGSTPSILASTPIFITESPAVEIYDSVWNNFTLSTENSVVWSVVEDPANIAIDGADATITRICYEDVPRTLLVTKDGVSKKVKVIIAKYESPELAAITTTPTVGSGVCLGQKITLETTSGYDTYAWAGANLLSADTYNVEAQPTIRTTYTVTATNGHDCTSTVNITITPDNSPTPKTTSNDYVWTGAINDAWNTNNNWVLYNNSTHEYQIPAEAPNASTHNVFVEQYGTSCVSNWADASNDIALNNITIGENAEMTVEANKNLTVSGNIANTGTLDLLGDVTFNGTARQTLSGSGTLTINNINVNNTHSDGVIAENTLDITGNVTVGNNSKLNVTGTAVLNGNATQTLSGTGSMAVSNIVFNNSNGFNATGLENNLAVNTSATFTNGIYDGNMVFGKSANAIDASRISYVNGEVSKTGNGDSFIFPTGNDNVYGQIEAIVGDEDKATIRFHHKSGHGFSETEYPRWWNLADMNPDNNPQFDHVSNFEYWDVFASADLTDATLSIYAGDANDHFSTPTSFDIANIYGAMYKNGLWRNIGGGSGSVSPSGETIILENVTILGNSSRSTEFTKTSIGSKSQETILPIELLSFSAHCNGNTIGIDWSTASERNNDYFILEKSLDAINFNEIARIAGAGKSIEQIDYSYTDYDYFGGDVYYRLIQVDYDGTKTYSEIISAKCSNWETDPNISVFPNPFSSELTIVLENFRNEPATIEIFDVMGRTIKQMQVDSPHNEYETSFNLDNIPAGIYNVRVRTSSSTLNRQIVKE